MSNETPIIDDLTVAQLKLLLTAHGLPITGVKQELLDRLATAGLTQAEVDAIRPVVASENTEENQNEENKNENENKENKGENTSSPPFTPSTPPNPPIVPPAAAVDTTASESATPCAYVPRSGQHVSVGGGVPSQGIVTSGLHATYELYVGAYLHRLEAGVDMAVEEFEQRFGALEQHYGERAAAMRARAAAAWARLHSEL